MTSFFCRRSVRALVLGCSLLCCSRNALAAEVTDAIEIKQEQQRFSMEFREADIKDVLRAVGQAASLNMIVSDAVSGQVSLSLKDVDVLDALASILRTKGLTYVRERNIVRVVAVAEAKDEDMEMRVFPLWFAEGKETLAVVDKIKSEKAKVSVDTRMNAIVVKDLSLNIDRMERLLRKLDTSPPQVIIEAQIVEMSTKFARELGVQWGGQYVGNSGQGTTIVSGGTTGVGSGSTGGTMVPPVGSTVNYPLTGDIGMSGNAFAVNLPAAVGAGSGGAIGISFGKIGGKLALDLQLSAMQATGDGKILSSPKVMTMINKEAKISSGVDIPVRVMTTTSVGTTAEVKTIPASLLLSTIPAITSDNRIAMDIKVEKSEPDFSQQVDGIPTITRRNANTKLVVNNGETVVVGGIFTRSEGEYQTGVPLLQDIPLLGWLFKKTGKIENQAELMIFITPTIVKE